MDKKFILGMVTGFSLAALSIISYIPDIAEALYSIPPTQAWRTITPLNNQVITNDTDGSVSAINYRDTLIIATDGSINITIAQLNP